MAASGRLWPALIASGVGKSSQTLLWMIYWWWTGVVGGYYIFSAPLQEVSGKLPNNEPIGKGVSQAVKDGDHKSGYVEVSKPPVERNTNSLDPLLNPIQTWNTAEHPLLTLPSLL